MSSDSLRSVEWAETYTVAVDHSPETFRPYIYLDTLGLRYHGVYDLTRDDYLAGETDEHEVEGMVNFGDISGNLFSQQSQYASYYLGKDPERTNLAENVRMYGDPYEPHHLGIHFEDLPRLVLRLVAYRAAIHSVFEYETRNRRIASNQEREWGERILAQEGIIL